MEVANPNNAKAPSRHSQTTNIGDLLTMISSKLMFVVATLAMHETSITTQKMVRFWERFGDIVSN